MLADSPSTNVPDSPDGAQFLLGPARQRTLSGGWEPASEPVYPNGRTKKLEVPAGNTPDLFDERQIPFRWKERAATVAKLSALEESFVSVDAGGRPVIRKPKSHAAALTVRRAVQWCGLNARDEVQLRRVVDVAGTSHHLAGTFHCGRALCPSCGPFVTRRRIEALSERAHEVKDEGLRHFHVVLNVRHHKGVRWDALRETFSQSWPELRGLQAWRRSVVGFVRTIETTWSETNGHHFHVHALLTVRAGADVDELREAIRDQWERSVAKDREVCARLAQPKKKPGREAPPRRRCNACGADGNFHVYTCPTSPGRVIPGRTVDFDAQERDAAAHGRRGWFSEVLGNPGDTLAYIVDKLLREDVAASHAKRGSRLWDLPARAYVEIWFASKGMRWFSSGGIWRVKPELEEEENADELRDSTGEVVGAIFRADWQAVPYDGRAWIAGLVNSRTLSPDVIAHAWRSFARIAAQYGKEKSTMKVRPRAGNTGPPSDVLDDAGEVSA